MTDTAFQEVNSGNTKSLQQDNRKSSISHIQPCPSGANISKRQNQQNRIKNNDSVFENLQNPNIRMCCVHEALLDCAPKQHPGSDMAGRSKKRQTRPSTRQTETAIRPSVCLVHLVTTTLSAPVSPHPPSPSFFPILYPTSPSSTSLPIRHLPVRSPHPPFTMTRLRCHRVTALPPSPTTPTPAPPESQPPSQQSVQSAQSPTPHPLRHPPLSKNLRWTAVALVSKLQTDRERPAAAVADEVAQAATRDMLRRFPGRDVAPVERNTRRRVYDALKVMVAVGSLQRFAKRLRWIGVDHLQMPIAGQRPPLNVQLCESRRRIGKKKALIAELNRSLAAYQSLLRLRKSTEDTVLEKDKLPFPLVLVKSTGVKLRFSSDRRRLQILSESSFSLYSETDVVVKMSEKCTKKSRTSRKRRRVSESTPTPAPKKPKIEPTSPVSPEDIVPMRSALQRPKAEPTSTVKMEPQISRSPRVVNIKMENRLSPTTPPSSKEMTSSAVWLFYFGNSFFLTSTFKSHACTRGTFSHFLLHRTYRNKSVHCCINNNFAFFKLAACIIFFKYCRCRYPAGY